MLLGDLDNLKAEVLENEEKKYGLAFFEIIVESNPYCFYFYVSKSASPETEPNEIGLFCL
jgi:hypothetical protein